MTHRERFRFFLARGMESPPAGDGLGLFLLALAFLALLAAL